MKSRSHWLRAWLGGGCILLLELGRWGTLGWGRGWWGVAKVETRGDVEEEVVVVGEAGG